MSNAVHEAGSPLADYLAEDLSGLAGNHLRPDSPTSQKDDLLGSTSRPSQLVEDADGSGLSSDVRTAPYTATSSDHFSEQFKYIICSSPLLEKDYVPGHRDRDGRIDESDLNTREDQVGPSTPEGKSVLDTLKSAYPIWITQARERWDISLAALGLIYGVRTLLGWLPVILATSLAFTILLNSQHSKHPSQNATPSTPFASPMPTPTPLDPKHASMEQIKRLITSSRDLDDSVETALTHLTKQPGNSSHLPALRLSLKNLTINMVDHLAAATSTLLELADKNELNVLGDMYDVQFSTGGRPGRRITLDSTDPDGTETTIPGPRNHRLSLTVSSPSASQYALPMSVSRSFPPHRSASDHNDPEDRFTQMPLRTPRTVKRSNRDMLWTPHRSPLSASSSETSPFVSSTGALSPPFTPGTKRRSLQRVPYDLPNAMEDQPLVRRMQGLRSASTSQSPFRTDHQDLTTPSYKRRSLQNMPYNPPSTVDEGRGADLARTRSMPFSDIQTLRSKYATGARSRSSSLLPPAPLSDGGLSPAPPRTPRIQRLDSVSPLTLPSLKAAYLDVHLRRRRVACCLLGLKFESPDNGYWDEVVKNIQALRDKMDDERQKLESALDEVTSELPDRILSESRPPWAPIVDDREYDFAPRTTDAQVLEERIAAVQNTLNRTWANLVLSRRALGAKDPNELDKAWRTVREDLGEMIRDWEKGRETIKRMASPDPSTATDSIPEDTVGDAYSHDLSQNAPSFIKTWSEDSEDRPPGKPELGAPITLAAPGDYHPEDYDEDIQLGREQIYEADMEHAPEREKSDLSREERINMTKSAREAGLSLKDYLERARDREAFERREKERETFAQGGMVVDELKGVMDVLRARKTAAAEGGVT